ncbi:MAG: hydroxypyruvate isomerase [Confluentimicrobium sp.]|uniref:hydroxypyruvate isomerase family protein n=1 Tax=Actibacterium sp. TaxID=1872125 RepID=UPI000C57E9AE|nr:TIM barrel protein [Actibacterium sp.]MBC58194.1 hydroxypyruvate isomerase [Actibacterium sp.]
MFRFAANLSFLFTEHAFPDRFAAARTAGFGAVEMLFPYAHSIDDIRTWLDAETLDLALFNTPVHDWAEGGRGVAAIPGETGRFRDEFDLALSYAEELRPAHIHIMSGLSTGSAARDCLIDNLAWAARHAPDQSLTIEPINRADMPGYFLNDFASAARIITEVGAPNLALQFDAYHAHRIHGDLAALWARFGPITRHVQIAGAPGRHEPAGGTIDYPAFFGQLAESGYDGFVGAEYHPTGTTTAGLAWFSRAPS